MRIEITEEQATKVANFLYEVDAAFVARGQTKMEVGRHIFAALHWGANGKDAKETALEIIRSQRE